MAKEVEGVWRTIRGRRVFIAKGEDLATAMRKSGKFENLKREDVQKAKKQLDVEKAREKWNKEYDTDNYSKVKTDEEREKLRQRQNKANENLDKAYKNRDEFMSLYDDKRDESELSWQDKVAKNTREANRKAKEIENKRGKGEYMFHEDKWQDDYYGTFREKEEKNARIKEEPDNAPYEPVDAYKGFKEKADELDKTRKTWTGAEYTNDEFMEHLEDANWHTERKMIEEAGLTNKQLRELKKNVKLDRYGADLDREKTQKLIDKVKKEFPSDDDKIKTYKEKKQSNNKIENEYYGSKKAQLDLEMSKYTSKEKLERAKEKLQNSNLDKEERQYYQDYIEKREGTQIKDILKQSNNKNEYTRQELKDKYGTDNVDLINAGKEKENRVSLKEEKKVKDNVIPRDFKKGYGKFKVVTSASDNIDDRYEITKDEFGTYHAKNLRTGETYAVFSSQLRNGNLFEFEKDDTKTKIEEYKKRKGK